MSYVERQLRLCQEKRNTLREKLSAALAQIEALKAAPAPDVAELVKQLDKYVAPRDDGHYEKAWKVIKKVRAALLSRRVEALKAAQPVEAAHLEANTAAYRVYCNAADHQKYVAWRDVQECIKAYNSAVLRWKAGT